MGLTARDRDAFEKLRARLDRASYREQLPAPTAEEFAPIDPMLAETFDGDLADVDEDEWVLERKYDGTRIILERFAGQVALYTRRHVERSATLPRISLEALDTLPDGVILDGETAYTDSSGGTSFHPIHAGSVPAHELILYVFDVLVVDGESVERRPLMERKELLSDIVPDGELITAAPFHLDGFGGQLRNVEKVGEEGVMLKKRSSRYHRGTRSSEWVKVKLFTERDVIVVGYTEGEGRREGLFGALVMSDGEDCIGRVGSGFTRRELEELREMMVETDEQPFSEKRVGRPYTAVEPFVIEVMYQEVGSEGKLRAPVFRRLRPDKPLEDVQAL